MFTGKLALIKVRANEEQRQGVILLTNTFRGNIIDVAVDSLIIEMTGGQAKIDAFLNLLSGYEIFRACKNRYCRSWQRIRERYLPELTKEPKFCIADLV